MPLWNEKLLQNPNFQFIFHRLIPYLTLTEIAPIFAKLPFPMLKNFVVFDVGANHGIWSAAFLHAAAHKTKEIHLFEPLDGNVAAIRANIAAGLYQGYEDLLTLNHFGLSDQAGSAEIFYDTPTSALASIDNAYSDLPGKRQPMEHRQSIKLDTLDVYCAANAIAGIDVLKVDVEGHEMPVLRGAGGLFERRQILICLFEFGPHQLGRRETFKDFFDFFDGFGYALYRITEPMGDLRLIPNYSVVYEKFDKVSMFLAQAAPKPRG